MSMALTISCPRESLRRDRVVSRNSSGDRSPASRVSLDVLREHSRDLTASHTALTSSIAAAAMVTGSLAGVPSAASRVGSRYCSGFPFHKKKRIWLYLRYESVSRRGSNEEVIEGTERPTETRRRRARGPRDMVVEQKKRRREGTDTEPVTSSILHFFTASDAAPLKIWPGCPGWTPASPWR